MTYPTKGVELIVPPIVEQELTGWIFTVNFTRRGQDYSAKLWRSGWEITRNGAKIRAWDDLPAVAQKIIVKSKASFA